MFYFTPLPGFFSPFPRGTVAAIARLIYPGASYADKLTALAVGIVSPADFNASTVNDISSNIFYLLHLTF